MKQITIVMSDQNEERVDAYVHGKFACNCANAESIFPPAEARWTITHVASGLAVAAIWGRAAARRLARRLDAAVEADITREDVATKSAAWKAFVAIVGPIVKGEQG